MEDLITIILAVLVGVFSLLGNRKKKTPAPKIPQPDEIMQPGDYTADYEYEGEPVSIQRPEPAKVESPFDVLGRILRGDFSGFDTQPQHTTQADREFHDPLASRRKAAKVVEPEPVVTKPAPKPRTFNFNDHEAMRNAIIMQEILGPPKARRRNRHI